MILGSLLAWAGCSTPPKERMPARYFQGHTRVACIGDSITAGAGLANPANEAYPAVLARLLGPAYEVRNFGVSGSTLSRDGDHAYFDLAQFQEAREWLPEVVVIALGTNDSKPQNWRYQATFERDLYTMVRSFMTLPSQPVVYVCTPPPVFKDLGGIRAEIVAKQISPIIRLAAARQGWPTIDLQRALLRDGELYPDGVHPDADGALSIANQVEAALRGR